MRGLNRLAKNNPITYYLVGSVPGKLQEKIAEKWGRGRNYYCLWHLAMVSGLTVAKYFGGESLEGSRTATLELGSIACYILAGLGITLNSARAAYLLARKRPVGDLILEGGFHYLKRTKKVKKILRRVGLDDLIDELE